MTSKGNNVDLLSNNYNDMDETGKEKLEEISKYILKIWKTVNDEKPKEKIEDTELKN